MNNKLNYLFNPTDNIEQKFNKVTKALWTVDSIEYNNAMAWKSTISNDEEVIIWKKNNENKDLLKEAYDILKIEYDEYLKSLEKYEGNKDKEGRKEGKGIIYYSDGSFYEGFFSNDLREGFGIFYSKNGKKKYEGIWSKDKLDGFAIIYNDDKIIYKGNVKDNLYEGLGIYYYNNNYRYEGFFNKGKKINQGTLYFPTGAKITGEFNKISVYEENVTGVYIKDDISINDKFIIKLNISRFSSGRLDDWCIINEIYYYNKTNRVSLMEN